MAKKHNGTTGVNDGTQSIVYLSSLKIRNIRCFGGEEQTLDLSDGHGGPAPWTLILGENGTGKTTLLQAIVVAALERKEEAGRPVVRVGLNSWLVMTLKRRSNSRGDSSSQVTVFADRYEGRANPSERTLQRSLLVREANGIETKGDHFTTLYGAYGASRRWGRTQLDTAKHAAGASLFSSDIPLLNPTEWLLQTDYSALKTASERTRAGFDQVRDVLIDLLPDVNDISIITNSEGRRTPEVQFHTPYGWVAFDQMGYGYQSLVTWVVDLASRMFDAYPESVNPLHEAAICLVDEIDLHLHPTWQRNVMWYLSERFPNVQFIATAHSPLIVQSAPDVKANIAVLRREGDHVVIDNDVDAVRGWRADQILASDLYDLPPRSPAVQKLLDEQNDLLGKTKLTGDERRRLDSLESEIRNLPIGNTPEEIERNELLRQTLDVLGNMAEKNA